MRSIQTHTYLLILQLQKPSLYLISFTTQPLLRILKPCVHHCTPYGHSVYLSAVHWLWIVIIKSIQIKYLSKPNSYMASQKVIGLQKLTNMNEK